MKVINASDVTDVIDNVKRQIETHNSFMENNYGSKLSFRIKRIIEDHILELYDDEKDRHAYAIRIELHRYHPNTFFNLLVYKNDVGNISEAYIMRYKMDMDFARAYYRGEAEMSSFEGKIKRFKLDKNPKQNPIISNPYQCEETSFSGGGGGGSTIYDSGGSTDSSTGSGGGSYSVCTTTTYTVPCTCKGHDPGERCTCSNQPYSYSVTQCQTIVAFDDCLDPCSDPSGSSPINEPILDDLYDPYPYDNIIPERMLFDPEFTCLYDKFIEGNSSVFNNTIGSFADLTSHHLNFDSCESDNVRGCSTRTSSEWTTESNGKHITIFLNPNASALEMAETILHEGIHAAAMLALENEQIPNGLNTVQYLQYYRHYNGYRDHADHVFIADYYLKPIARALRNLDARRHPEYKYYGIVYEGIERAIDEAGVQRLIDEYSQYKVYNQEVLSNTELCE